MTHPKRPYTFQLLLHPAQRQQLDDLSKAWRRSRGSVIRMLLIGAHDHQFGGRKTCANTDPCRCPQYFPQVSQPPDPSQKQGGNF